MTVNEAVSLVGPVFANSVRNYFFSDLESKYDVWLKDVENVQSAKYISNLKAISEPSTQQWTPTGRWCGFFEYLIGVPPTKKIFEVAGLDDFKAVYVAIIPFFINGTQPAECNDNARFMECYDFAHVNPKPGEPRPKRCDSKFTLTSFVKYGHFLEKQEKEFEETIIMIQKFMDKLAAIRTKPFILRPFCNSGQKVRC